MENFIYVFLASLTGCYCYEFYKNFKFKTIHHEHIINFIISFAVAIFYISFPFLIQVFGIMVEAFNDSPLSPLYFSK